MDHAEQLWTLLLLALPVASIAWTVTHEEVFREPREYCERRAQNCRSLLQRKFFYLFTCEYCFSHYVALAFTAMAEFKLLFDDWRGYLIAWFALVWVANFYMGIFGRLRIDIKNEKLEAKVKEKRLQNERAGDSSDRSLKAPDQAA